MDARVTEELPMPATYARHLARVFDPDALFAGTGIDPETLDDLGAASLRLDYPPTPYADRYRRYFEPEVRFDEPFNGLVFPSAWRSLPNLGYTESSWPHALRQCEATSASSRERETLSDVRACLCRAFERSTRRRPLPTLEDVAAELHLSPRTLIRRLCSLGTSYQEITREFLQARARQMLANDEITIKEVAGMLGFDSPANFGRTFKRWFGTSPGTYRATRLGRDHG